MDCSPPGSSVHGILQARMLEWGCHPLLQGIFLTQGLNLHLLGLLWAGGFLITKPPGKPWVDTQRCAVSSSGLCALWQNRSYFVNHARSPKWMLGLNNNMGPIYSIWCFRAADRSASCHLPSVVPKPGLGTWFQVCYLKNAGVLKGFITSENPTQGRCI